MHRKQAGHFVMASIAALWTPGFTAEFFCGTPEGNRVVLTLGQ